MLFNPYYLLFLPANSGVDNHTWASAFSQQEINGGNQPSSRGGKSPGAPVVELTLNTKSQKTAINNWSLGVLDWPRDPRGITAQTPITDRNR